MPSPAAALGQLFPLDSDRGRSQDIGFDRPPKPTFLTSLNTIDSSDGSSSATSTSSISTPASRSASCGSITKALPKLVLDDPIFDNEDDSAVRIVSRCSGPTPPQRRRASTTLLLSQDEGAIRQILADEHAGAAFVKKCCGGGCVKLASKTILPLKTIGDFIPLTIPRNLAFESLNLTQNLQSVALNTDLDGLLPLPDPIMSFHSLDPGHAHKSQAGVHPPTFVQPHPPYQVFSAPIHHARELTKPGALKRTMHMDIDVTDYPEEVAGVDFKVGGAIGVCPRNSDDAVDDIFTCLGVPHFLRNKPMLLNTGSTRWPTIWGEEESRKLTTTRRELLTWCVDIQSAAPTKQLFRVLGEYASHPSERKILMYLASQTGQHAFCGLRDSHLTLVQLLNAFPSATPPLPSLLSVLPQLMPRFYSLSNDPDVSAARCVEGKRKFIEVAVTLHQDPDWKSGTRNGVGSGFIYRLVKEFIDAEAEGRDPPRIFLPMFRGLMANPLSREADSKGPMLLVGAGVGIAPFRGFILNRLKYANCANKVWLIQGIRDASLDQLYAGELGPDDSETSVKHVVQSRQQNRTGNEARYVQDEVRAQADTVWSVINAPDGRVCVCGSSKGMGEGVEEALIDVACLKGGLNRDEAVNFWQSMQEGGQYITETW